MLFQLTYLCSGNGVDFGNIQKNKNSSSHAPPLHFFHLSQKLHSPLSSLAAVSPSVFLFFPGRKSDELPWQQEAGCKLPVRLLTEKEKRARERDGGVRASW